MGSGNSAPKRAAPKPKDTGPPPPLHVSFKTNKSLPRHYSNPLPAWVSIIQPDPAIDTGIMGCSDGMNIINPNTVVRQRKGNFETDGARWGAPLSKGKHVFEVNWPVGGRGQTASMGVGSERAAMFVKPRDSLIGCNDQTWGLDISKRKTIHNKQLGSQTMPRGGTPPVKQFVYVDCDSRTVGFGSEVDYYGAPHNFPESALPVYLMIGVSQPNAQVTIIYRGSENRALANAQPPPVNNVVAPQPVPGGQTVIVINQGVAPPQQPGPSVNQPGPVEAPPPYVEKPPVEEQKPTEEEPKKAEEEPKQAEEESKQAEEEPKPTEEPKE